MLVDSFEVIITISPIVKPSLNFMSFESRIQNIASFHAQSNTFPKDADEQVQNPSKQTNKQTHWILDILTYSKNANSS